MTVSRRITALAALLALSAACTNTDLNLGATDSATEAMATAPAIEAQ